MSTRVTLSLCAAAALLEGFDTQSMGVAAPRLVAEFGLSTSQSGVLFSIATLGLFAGAAVGGRISDYYGRRRTLIGAILVLGIGSLLTATVNRPGLLFAVRLLTGLGLGGAMPNFISLASESVRAETRLSTVAAMMAGMPLGGAGAGLVALGAAFGWGWRVIFLVGGTLPLITAALMLRWLPESKAFTDRPLEAVPRRMESIGSILFGTSRGLTTMLLWICFFFTQLVLLLMLNWLPSLMVGLGYSRSQASVISVCFNLSGTICAVYLGRLFAGTRRRMWVVITYGGMAVALAAVATLNSTFVSAAIACSLAGAFIIGAQIVQYALAPLYYAPAIRGMGVGAAVAVGRLGSVFGPLFAGSLLAAGGSSAGVFVAIVPFVVAGGCAAFVLTSRPQSVT